jgi:acetyl-CoA C-acetyltransferase
MPDAVIVSAVRSPIGRAHKGSLADVRPEDLAASVIRAALDRVPQLDPTHVEDLLLGCAEPHDEQGMNLARRVSVQLGLDGLPGTTVNRFCAWSVQTTSMAFNAL